MSAAAKRTAELQEKNRRAQRRFRERQKVRAADIFVPILIAQRCGAGDCCHAAPEAAITQLRAEGASAVPSQLTAQQSLAQEPSTACAQPAALLVPSLRLCVCRIKFRSWRTRCRSSRAASRRSCLTRRPWTAASASSTACCACARSTSRCCSARSTPWSPTSSNQTPPRHARALCNPSRLCPVCAILHPLRFYSHYRRCRAICRSSATAHHLPSC